jgi:hypothetical protein
MRPLFVGSSVERILRLSRFLRAGFQLHKVSPYRRIIPSQPYGLTTSPTFHTGHHSLLLSIMGKSKGHDRPPPGVYRDDPDRDDAASMSSAVLLGDRDFPQAQDDEDLDGLPAYADVPQFVPGEDNATINGPVDSFVPKLYIRSSKTDHYLDI